MNKRGKITQLHTSPNSFMQQNERNASWTRSPGGKSPSGRMSRWPCKDYHKGTCTTSFCEKWHPPECLFYKTKSGCRFGEKCSFAHRQVDEQPTKRSKKNDDKSAVAILKNTRKLGCVSQDMEPPKSSSILRKSSNILMPIRCVQFTKAVLRRANIRDQNPSLGMIYPGDLHQHNPNAPKFEDRSQEETEWQERYAREATWRLAKNILNLKEKHKTTFLSPLENWCLPVPSTSKPKEREFVVDSGASMHMISKKDLNSAELETVTTSRSSTTVKTNSHWWSADEWRGHSLCQRNGCILDNESRRGYASSFIARKALRWTRILIWVDQRWKTTSHSKMLFEYSVRRRTSFRSWFLVYQRVLPQACLLQHPWHFEEGNDHSKSSSSSSTSTPMTSSKEIDHSDHLPAVVSSESVDRQVRETRIQGRITIQQSCQVKVWIDKYGETHILLKHQTNCWIN